MTYLLISDMDSHMVVLRADFWIFARNYFWPCLEDPMGYWGSSLGLPCAKHLLSALYYLSSPSVDFPSGTTPRVLRVF